MRFNYKGQEYDTDKPQPIQMTKDVGLMRKVIDEYYGFGVPDEDYQQLLFDFALLADRYSSIIRRLTNDELSIAGTYPEWVINEVSEQQSIAIREDIEDIISITDGREELIEKLRDSFPNEDGDQE